MVWHEQRLAPHRSAARGDLSGVHGLRLHRPMARAADDERQDRRRRRRRRRDLSHVAHLSGRSRRYVRGDLHRARAEREDCRAYPLRCGGSGRRDGDDHYAACRRGRYGSDRRLRESAAQHSAGGQRRGHEAGAGQARRAGRSSDQHRSAARRHRARVRCRDLPRLRIGQPRLGFRLSGQRLRCPLPLSPSARLVPVAQRAARRDRDADRRRL